MKAWVLLLLLPLAGCLDGPVDSLDAQHAYQAASRGLEDYEYVLFLGIAATEGPVDDAAYAAALEGTWAELEAAFGPTPQDGLVGDGRAAAWVTTHYVWDKETDRAGGLFTQVTPQGVQRVFLPFVGVYGGQPGTLATRGSDVGSEGPEPFMPDVPGRQALRAGAAHGATDDAPRLCPLETDTGTWRLDAVDAVAKARSEATFQEHLQAHPSGEYTYAYMPALSVDPACSTARLDGNRWTVLHTDLDGLMNGTERLAAQVRVDAANGTVLEAGLTPLLAPTRVLLEGRIDVEDPMLSLDEQVHAFSFDVGPGTALLDLHAIRREVPDGVRDAETRLLDPAGTVRSTVAFGTPVHEHLVQDPLPGTWRLEYAYQPTLPQGHHVVDVFARLDG